MSDKQAQTAIEETPDRNAPAEKPSTTAPAAGPHAKENLIDREKTPGSGSMPDGNGTDTDVGPD